MSIRTAEDGLLASLYLRVLEHPGPVELHDFHFGAGDDPNAAAIRIARLELPCDDGLPFWFSGSVRCTSSARSPELQLPHEHHFIAFGSSSKLHLAGLVAAAYHFDRFIARLGIDHTFPLGMSSPFRARGFTRGLIMVPTFRAAAPVHQVADRQIALLQVTPITESEFALKSEKGADALLAHWHRTHHDISAADLDS